MELLEGLHHLQLKPRTGLLNNKGMFISLMWMRSKHLRPTQVRYMVGHWMFLKNKTRNHPIDKIYI
eukprot:2796132-Prorocentrum_lima.AAC.1